MGAAFTPGPWSVSSVTYGSGKRHNILGRTGKLAVAHTYGDPRPAAENLANANLIAAAPELYTLGELALKYIEQERSLILESHCLLDDQLQPIRETLEEEVREELEHLEAAIAATRALLAKARAAQ